LSQVVPFLFLERPANPLPSIEAWEEKESQACRKLLRFLCDEGHSDLLRRLSYRRIHQRERFISQGEVSDCAYVIETGSCLLVVEKDSILHPVDHCGEGNIVGELSVLTGEDQNAHVEAQTDLLFTHAAQKAQATLGARCEGLRLQHEHGRNHVVEAAKAADAYAPVVPAAEPTCRTAWRPM